MFYVYTAPLVPPFSVNTPTDNIGGKSGFVEAKLYARKQKLRKPVETRPGFLTCKYTVPWKRTQILKLHNVASHVQ